MESGSDHGVKVRCKYSVPIAFKIPVPKPVVTKNPVKEIQADSLTAIKDSITIMTDSLITDSIAKDSLLKDSIIISTDTIANDSTAIQKQLENEKTTTDKPAKVKKRNAFIRFFRWLFGIKDKEETPEEVKEEEIIEKDEPVQQATEVKQENNETTIEQKKEL